MTALLEQVAPHHYCIHGRLTMQGSADVLHELFDLIHDKKNNLHQLTLDCSALESADSVLLAVIINVARAVEANNGVLHVTGFPEALRGLSRAYGIDSLIDRYMAHKAAQLV